VARRNWARFERVQRSSFAGPHGLILWTPLRTGPRSQSRGRRSLSLPLKLRPPPPAAFPGPLHHCGRVEPRGDEALVACLVRAPQLVNKTLASVTSPPPVQRKPSTEPGFDPPRTVHRTSRQRRRQRSVPRDPTRTRTVKRGAPVSPGAGAPPLRAAVRAASPARSPTTPHLSLPPHYLARSDLPFPCGAAPRHQAPPLAPPPPVFDGVNFAELIYPAGTLAKNNVPVRLRPYGALVARG